MQERSQKTDDTVLCCAVGKITMQKLNSTLSKMADDTATAEERLCVHLLQEIVALAKNRVSVEYNEQALSNGRTVWVERTQGHFPHIRLHGGALEDDPAV